MKYVIAHTATGQCDHWAAEGDALTLCSRQVSANGSGYGPCQTCDRLMRVTVTLSDDAPEWFTGVDSVWSAFGHRFMSIGGGNDTNVGESSCLTCGAQYDLVPDPADPSWGEYRSHSGAEPDECTGRCDLEHGSERYCQADDGRECDDSIETGSCEHTVFECNCNLCD